MKKHLLVTILLLMLFQLNINNITAGSTGKIKGTITDEKTGETLAGANIFIVGTSHGSASDANGFYSIRQVPPGSYELKVTYLGYQPVTVSITVKVDQDFVQDFKLSWEGVVAGEEVTVTAQAEGQLSAINQQIANIKVTSVVSAARIQEVPDANAAESVGRLPGISLKRSSGEGNEVVVRGMQPRLNLVTINNIRMPSTNENNSAVGLAGISQYMLDGIEVKKSLTAEDDADVVGGIVNLTLANAKDGFHWNAILDGMYNGLTDDYGSYRGSIQGSNRFFNSKLGIIGQLNIEEADRTNQALSANFGKDERITNNRGVFLQNGNFQLDEIVRNRSGVNVVLDYKLPKGKIQFNSIYNKFEEDRWEKDYQFDIASSEKGVKKEMISKKNDNYSLVNGINLESEIFGLAFFDFGASICIGNRETTNKDLVFRYDRNIDVPIDKKFLENPYGKIAYDIIPVIRDTSTNYQIFGIYQEDMTFKENESTFQTNLKIPFSLGAKVSGFVKVGGKMRFKDRDYDYERDGDDGIYGGDVDINKQILRDNPEIAWPWLWENRPPRQSYLPADPLYESETNKVLEDRVILKDFSQRRWVEQLVDRAMASNWAGLSSLKGKAGDLENDYDGDEKLYAAYLMTEFNWRKNVSLNIGLRYEKEKTKYKGYGVYDVIDADDILDSLAAVTRTNDFFLPSMTLRYNYAEWGDVRFAYSKSLARPEYYAFIPRYSADIEKSFGEVAGNPHLKPAVSNNFDLICSFFNNYIGLFTLGGFYKEIDNFFYQANFKVIDPVADNMMHAYDFIVPRGQYINVWLNLENKSNIKGIEIDWQTNFWYLPNPLNGLVLGINYTRISSKAYYYGAEIIQDQGPNPWELIETRVDSFQTRRLIDQPDDIFNLSVGYDYKDFSMRLAYYFQGKTLSKKSNNNETDGFDHDYSRLDLSMRQKLPINGLSIQFLLSNISAEPEQAYTYTKKYNNSEQYYGRTGSLGLRYEF